MPYNSQITRTGIGSNTTTNVPGGLIPEDASREIIKNATESSVVMQLARRLPNMSSAQRRMPVLNSLPTAYFINAGANPSDTGFKQTTQMQWGDVFINAEELAVIVPIPENVLADSAYDLWSEVRPAVSEAIGLAFDQAVLFGTNKPNIWPAGLVPQIVTAGNDVEHNDLTTGPDIYDEIFGVDGVLAKVEEDGFEVNGHLANLRLRAMLRGLRDTQGNPIFTQDMRDVGSYTLDSDRLVFARNGAFNPDLTQLLISGDWNKLVYAVRQDVSWKILDQAVITDPGNSNAIVYNLAQQDMVALRVTFRAGWALPRPVSRVSGTTGFPFAALVNEVTET